MKLLSCVEICTGAGGQALGLAMAGFVHVALVEYEKEYCEILKQNRPEISDGIDRHIKWLKTEYREALNNKAKELKAKK